MGLKLESKGKKTSILKTINSILRKLLEHLSVKDAAPNCSKGLHVEQFRAVSSSFVQHVSARAASSEY